MFLSQPVGLTSLIIILVCLTVILICDRILKKQTKKTLKHIDFMLDNEQDKNGLKANDYDGLCENRKDSRLFNMVKT